MINEQGIKCPQRRRKHFYGNYMDILHEISCKNDRLPTHKRLYFFTKGKKIKVSAFLNGHVNQKSASVIKYLHGKR